MDNLALPILLGRGVRINVWRLAFGWDVSDRAGGWKK